MRAWLFLACLLMAPLAMAQCPYAGPIPPTVWPTVTTFVPAQPQAGQPITLVLGPAEIVAVTQTQVVRTAPGEVTVTARYDDYSGFAGLPPPPLTWSLPLGSLPGGNYVVRLDLRNGGVAGSCPTLSLPLFVAGGTASSVPASGAPTLVTLMAALCGLAAWQWRRRRPAASTT